MKNAIAGTVLLFVMAMPAFAQQQSEAEMCSDVGGATLLQPISVTRSPRSPALQVVVSAAIQEGSPVHIVGILYAPEALRFLLKNNSDKTVESVIITGTIEVPDGCSLDKPDQDYAAGGHLTHLRIELRQQSKTSMREAPFDTSGLVLAAKELRAASLYVQVGVIEVDFLDGTRWRPNPYLFLRPALSKNNVASCSDLAGTLAALTQIDAVGFGSAVQLRIAEDPKAVATVSYECLLEDRKAICPGQKQ